MLQEKNPEGYLSMVLHKCMETMERYCIFYEENKNAYSSSERGEFRKEMRDKFNQAKNIGLTFQEALRTYHRQLAKEF